MRSLNLFIIAVSFFSMAAGLLFSFWPLIPLGIALLVLYGHTTLGISSGLLFDLLFGAPIGALSFLHFPFLLFAALCVGIRAASIRFILPHSDLGAL